MITDIQATELASRLDLSLLSRIQIGQFSKEIPSLTIDDGYRIQKEWVRIRHARGEHRVGWKIGLTSRAMQIATSITEPDFAPLLDTMRFEQGTDIPVDQFIKPRVEVELAFILSRPLSGPNISMLDVISATSYVVPAIEIIDARIEQFDGSSGSPRKVTDTISDLAANAGFILGGRPMAVSAVDLRWVSAILYKNAVAEETGVAAGVLNHPATGVAWLANRLSAHGESLSPGDIILSGSFTRPVYVAAGDCFHADYGPLGSIPFRFV